MEAPQPQPPSTNYLPGIGLPRQPGQGFEYAGKTKHLSDEDVLIQYAAKNLDLLIGIPITYFKDKGGLYLNNVPILVEKVIETDLKFKVITLPDSLENPNSPYRRWPQVIPREPNENLETHPYLFAAAGTDEGQNKFDFAKDTRQAFQHFFSPNIHSQISVSLNLLDTLFQNVGDHTGGPEVYRRALVLAATQRLPRDIDQAGFAAVAAAIYIIKLHLLWRKWIYPQYHNQPLAVYQTNDNWRESFNFPGNKAWTEYGNSTRIQKFEFTTMDGDENILQMLLATEGNQKPDISSDTLLDTIIEQIEEQHRGLPGERHLYAIFTKLSLIVDKLGPLVKLAGSWNSIDGYMNGHGRDDTFVCGPGEPRGENLFGQLPLIVFLKYVLHYDTISKKSLENLVDRMTSLLNDQPSAADRDLARKARYAINQQNYLSNAECPWIVIMAYFFGLDYGQEQILHELFVFHGGSTVQILAILSIMSYISCKKEENNPDLPGCAHYAENNKGPVYLINIVKRTVGELITEINRLVLVGIIPNNTIVCVLIDGHITTMLVSSGKLAFVELQGKNIRFIDFNEGNTYSAYFYRVVGGWRGGRAEMGGLPYEFQDIAVGQLICIPFFGNLYNLNPREMLGGGRSINKKDKGTIMSGGARTFKRSEHGHEWALSERQAKGVIMTTRLYPSFEVTKAIANNKRRAYSEEVSRQISQRDKLLNAMMRNLEEHKANIIILEVIATLYLNKMAERQDFTYYGYHSIDMGNNNAFTDMLEFWIIPYLDWRFDHPPDLENSGNYPRYFVEYIGLIFNFINGYDPTEISRNDRQEKKWGFTDTDIEVTIPSIIVDYIGKTEAIRTTFRQIYAKLNRSTLVRWARSAYRYTKETIEYRFNSDLLRHVASGTNEDEDDDLKAKNLADAISGTRWNTSTLLFMQGGLVLPQNPESKEETQADQDLFKQRLMEAYILCYRNRRLMSKSAKIYRYEYSLLFSNGGYKHRALEALTELTNSVKAIRAAEVEKSPDDAAAAVKDMLRGGRTAISSWGSKKYKRRKKTKKISRKIKTKKNHRRKFKSKRKKSKRKKKLKTKKKY